MRAQIHVRTGRTPDEMYADGGDVDQEDIGAVAGSYFSPPTSRISCSTS